MKYKISIAELLDPLKDSIYPRENKIYEQSIEDIDIAKLACYLNSPKEIKICQ